MKRTCLATGSWRCCLSLEIVSSIPAGSTIIYRFLSGFICVSPYQSIKMKPAKIYIASARTQFKINTHNCTCAFQTGCQLSSAASGMSLGLCFLTQFQWHETNELDNWLLAVLSQSGGHEFNPRRVYMRFPVPEHQN